MRWIEHLVELASYQTMGELLTWAESDSKAVLYGIVLGHMATCRETQRKHFTRCVAMLHVAIAWFCRPNAEQGGYREQLTCMSKHIWDYAACIEETYGCSLLKLNLH